MNKTGFQIKNNYFRAALYIELIVNNMKYRGIQCDFGRLTNVFFVTPDSLLFAVQRDTDFFQYTYCGRVFNPAQKGVLNKAGFAMHDPIAIGCMNAITRECENPELEVCHLEGGTTERSVTYEAECYRFLSSFGMTIKNKGNFYE